MRFVHKIIRWIVVLRIWIIICSRNMWYKFYRSTIKIQIHFSRRKLKRRIMNNNHLTISSRNLWMQIDLFYCRHVISREGQTQNSLRRIGQDVRWAFWLLKTKKNLTRYIYIYLTLSLNLLTIPLLHSIPSIVSHTFVNKNICRFFRNVFPFFSEIGQDRFVF